MSALLPPMLFAILLYFLSVSLYLSISLSFSQCIHHHLIRLNLLSITLWPLCYSAFVFFLHCIHSSRAYDELLCWYFSSKFVVLDLLLLLYYLLFAAQSDACNSIFLFGLYQSPLVSHTTTSARLLHPVFACMPLRSLLARNFNMLDMWVWSL